MKNINDLLEELYIRMATCGSAKMKVEWDNELDDLTFTLPKGFTIDPYEISAGDVNITHIKGKPVDDSDDELYHEDLIDNGEFREDDNGFLFSDGS